MAQKNHLVYAIMRFLDEQGKNMDEERKESLEVALQCLETVFGLSLDDKSQDSQYPLPAPLDQLFSEALQKYPVETYTASTVPTTASAARPLIVDKEKAEKYKVEGNEHMKKEEFKDALKCYTSAIESDTSNAVYYCNRAAAYSRLDDHSQALADCISALNIDPTYSKAHGRKGLAHSALQQHQEAIQCFKKAIELDPSNASYKQNLEIAEQKLREGIQMPGGMPGGMPPGMPPGLGGLNMGGLDFSGLLSNPALMNMATNMMQNPQMQQMMASFMGNSAAPEQGPQGISGLLQAGQQLAQQMQSTNPELVEELRNQMRNPGDPEEDGDPPSNPPQ